MPAIRNNVPPHIVTGIDAGNYFARGLQRAVIAQTGSDLVHTATPTRDTNWTYVNTKYGKAMAFDGTNGGMSFAEPAPTTGLTFYARVFSTATGTANRNIFALGSSTPSGAYSVQLRRETTTKVQGYAFAAAVDQTTASGDNNFSDNTWFDYCFVWNGADILLYRDGVVQAVSSSGTITSLRTTAVLTIGESNFSAKQGWLGYIAFAYYWRNRAFSARDVFEFYNNRYQILRRPQVPIYPAAAAATGNPFYYYAQQRRAA